MEFSVTYRSGLLLLLLLACVYRSMQHQCMSSWTHTLPGRIRAIGLFTVCLCASSPEAPTSLSAHSLELCFLSLGTSSPSLAPWLPSPSSLASSTTCTSRSLNLTLEYCPPKKFHSLFLLSPNSSTLVPKSRLAVATYIILSSRMLISLLGQLAARVIMILIELKTMYVGSLDGVGAVNCYMNWQ